MGVATTGAGAQTGSGGKRSVRHAATARVVATAEAGQGVLVIVRRHSAVVAWTSYLVRCFPNLLGLIRVTTWLGLACELLRHEPDLGVIESRDRRTLIAELLTAEHASGEASVLWPTQHRFLLSPSFLDAVARELPTVGVVGEGGSPSSLRRIELHAFAVRYRTALAGRGLIEADDAYFLAAQRCRQGPGDGGSDALAGVSLVVIDAVDSLREPERVLAVAVADAQRAAGREIDETGTGPPHAGDGPLTDGRCSVVRIHHPSLEADATLAVVHDWLSAGVDPERIAVVVPRRNDALQAELRSAADRAGVVLSGYGRRLGDYSVVQDCHATVTRATGASAAPGAMANAVFEWWLHHARGLLGDPVAVEVIRSFHRAVEQSDTIDDALDGVVAPRPGGVMVVALADAGNRPFDSPWQGIVVVEAVEGVLPPLRRGSTWFSASDDVARADDPALTHRTMLAQALSGLADDGSLVAIAAPMPGVLPSRFVEGWKRRELALVRRTHPDGPSMPLAETTHTVPIFPIRQLRLSASQLTTFEDCSWRYAFEYGLGLRGAGGASASAGSLAHKVLEEFLRPRPAGGDDDAGEPDHSLERLMMLLDEFWDASEFRYSAQALDYRRRAEQWLRNWWADFDANPPTVARTEYRFEVPLEDVTAVSQDGSAHVIVGSIDRVDVVPPLVSGSEPTTRVVDYKSGSPKSQTEVDSDLQLAVYHYAASHDPELRRLGRPAHLELHYLQDDVSRQRLKVMTRPVTEGLERATAERIGLLADAILAEGYKPNIDATCAYCAFHRLCPTQPSGRHVV